MYYLLIFTFAVCCASSVYEVELVEHLHQEHKIRKRETGTTPPTETVTDNHDYYTSKVVSDPDGMYWTELEGDSRHHLSNAQYKTFSIISLSFNFTFYGHFMDTFAITTQGFLHMSSFHHRDLDYSHSRYIAPLMADFDTIANDSHILYRDYGDSCVIEWRNVKLHNQSENGKYTFQTTLFENGTILFSYKSIPETNISDSAWPVKVGIADSFHYDIGQTKFIVRYHQIQINATDLKDSVAIILDPLPTCNTASSCDECTKLKSGFNCAWCHSVSRCSDGFDRHIQEWVEANCSRKAVISSDMCTISTTTSTTTTAMPSTIVTTAMPTSTVTLTPPSTTVTPTIPSTNVITTYPTLTTAGNTEKPQKEGQTAQKDSGKTLQIVIPIVVVCSVLLILVGVWVVYARAHPNTASGQWLIENRPGQIKKKMSDRFSNISFSKDSETGDKVRFA